MMHPLSWKASLLLSTLIVTGQATNVTGTNSTCVGINAISPSCKSNESPHYRDFFYVGGHYVDSALGNLTYDQIYVEKLTPLGGASQPKPMVFFHGGGKSQLLHHVAVANALLTKYCTHRHVWSRKYLSLSMTSESNHIDNHPPDMAEHA